MPTGMLTTAEREFLDLDYREGFLHEREGHAHEVAQARGITYDHCAQLWHPYKEAREHLGPWPEAFPPIPPDPSLPCPWESREDNEKRIEAFTHEVLTT
jgi:hypothetical protein